MNRKFCNHLTKVLESEVKTSDKHVCEECIKTGSKWIHLRICQTCGETLCCDSSPNQHARNHFLNHSHPTFSSAEEGERWVYCYKDDLVAGY
jgi:hypothetical protein